MEKDIRPQNAKSQFDFKFKNIIPIELDGWMDEEIKKATHWDAAIREFNKHLVALFEVSFGSPYPINSFSIGAAELNGNNVHIRLFLFPMDSPKYQAQSVGQIFCEFNLNANSSDLKVWPDFLESNEIDEGTWKIMLIQATLRWIAKFIKEHPQSIRILREENEINGLNLPPNQEKSSQMFQLFDIKKIGDFMKDKISSGNKVAILFTEKDKGTFIVGEDLF